MLLKRKNPLLRDLAELKKISERIMEIKTTLEERMSSEQRDLYTGRGIFNQEWMEKYSIPQSLQFMIDLLPTIYNLTSTLPWGTTLEVLDIGTATGAGANLLGQLNNAEFFGTPMKVDAMDIDDSYKKYADAMFPFINYIVADIFQYDHSKKWDLIICSHVIEHFTDPTEFIKEIQRRTRKWAIFYAPYNEIQLLEGHLRRINDEYIDSFNPISKQIIESRAWRHPNDSDSKCVVFVLKGI